MRTVWWLVAVGVLGTGGLAGAARADAPPAVRLDADDLDARVQAGLREVLKNGSRFNGEARYTGAYYLYGGALLAVDPLLDHRPHLQKAIHKGLTDAGKTASYEECAALLRRVIDQIMAEVDSAPNPDSPILWERLGGKRNVKQIVGYLIDQCITDPKVNLFRDGQYRMNADQIADMKAKMVQLTSAVTGGPDRHPGRSMKEVHERMHISDAEFDAMLKHLSTALLRHNVRAKDAEAVKELVGFTRKHIVTADRNGPKAGARGTLWERLGGETQVKKIIGDFVDGSLDDPQVNFFRGGTHRMNAEQIAGMKTKMVQLMSAASEGPYKYEGKSMRSAHEGMEITDAEFDALVKQARTALLRNRVGPGDAEEVIVILESTRKNVVSRKKGKGDATPPRPSSSRDRESEPFRPAEPALAEAAPSTIGPLLEGAEGVVHVNVRQALRSPALREARAALRSARAALRSALVRNETALDVFEDLGMTSLEDIESLTVSWSMPSMKGAKGLVVVRGTFNVPKIQAAAEKFARDLPAGLKFTKPDDGLSYEFHDPMLVAAALLNANTLVVAVDGEGTLDAVRAACRRAGKPSPGLDDALSKFTGKESLRMALAITDELKKQIGKVIGTAEIAPHLKMMTGSLELTDSATLTLAIRTDDEEAASKLQGLIKQGMGLLELLATSDEKSGPLLGEVLKATRLAQERGSVGLVISVTPTVLATFVRNCLAG